MRCEAVQRSISAHMDGNAISVREQRHLAGCPACQEFQRDLATLHQRTLMLTAQAAPDFVPRVMGALPKPRRRQLWLAPAAGFLAGLLIGVVIAGGASGPETSAALVAEVIARQDVVDHFSGSFVIKERIRTGEERTYRGTIAYSSPEYLALVIGQTDAPVGWSENSVVRIIDSTTSLTIEPYPCPQLGGCRDGSAQARTLTGRDPFSPLTPAPLDAVVPVEVLKGGPEPFRLSTRDVAGLDTIGFEVTAAQARPLLDAYFDAGNFREIHDSDLVAIWLESNNFTPLLLTITASSSPDRATWAAVRDYDDKSSPYLTLEFESAEFEPIEKTPVTIPDGAVARNAGYAELSLPAPIEIAMPLVSSGRMQGRITSQVWAWSDGRSWVRLDQTDDWEGPGLFGNAGLPVQAVSSDQGTIYVAGDDSTVFVHSAEYDAVITGSVSGGELIATASLLSGTHDPTPADWPEAPASADQLSNAYLPADLEGFGTPTVSAIQGVLVVDLFGGGDRSARITQRPGDRISPPFDPDARTVISRGAVARYSPMLGVLEWVEEGIVFTVEGSSLEDLIAIAETLERSE